MAGLRERLAARLAGVGFRTRVHSHVLSQVSRLFPDCVRLPFNFQTRTSPLQNLQGTRLSSMLDVRSEPNRVYAGSIFSAMVFEYQFRSG